MGDRRCCIDLENTYDLQLIIEGPIGKEIKIYTNIKSTKTRLKTMKLYYFPTVIIRNIAFKQNYYKDNDAKRIITIIGYPFGEKVDSSPIDERLRRFGNS